MNLQRLGVLGGTFDPVHEGHLNLARQALACAGLDRVILLPMACPIHRTAEADPQTRFAMCRLAVQDEKDMDVSEAGMAPSVRYTMDTLPVLRREYPDARLTFILGADKLPSLPYWRGADRLFAQCDFLCFPRTGVSTTEAMEKVRAAGARVTLLPLSGPPYSASMIRARTAQYEDAPGLDRRVLCYMAQQGLYQPDFLPRLRKMMNPRRFKHTLGVRQEAVRLADLHGIPIQRSALAGLLHDCAKGMPVPVMAQIARDNHLVEDVRMLSSGAMLHGPVGAWVARKEFGIRDEEVLNAIRSHTIGRPGMTPLELCIFVADATEAGREEYEGLTEIRRLADMSLPAAALKSLMLTQQYLEQSGRPFFPTARKTAQYLESILTESEKQLLQSIQ